MATPETSPQLKRPAQWAAAAPAELPACDQAAATGAPSCRGVWVEIAAGRSERLWQWHCDRSGCRWAEAA